MMYSTASLFIFAAVMSAASLGVVDEVDPYASYPAADASRMAPWNMSSTPPVLRKGQLPPFPKERPDKPIMLANRSAAEQHLRVPEEHATLENRRSTTDKGGKPVARANRSATEKETGFASAAKSFMARETGVARLLR
eukprot:gnl/TRDRNA2_/TRDRNA2_185506_c0_seq1.p1 gnl/TRDRNA2_/TRDRNA2_185506_c0~~gnl/TRDRNA2_/TRDRNA2_185506_c0_seq1.p1  ORF type:complete len:138 (-),score=18.69 gnl/TRDRNA2_/TRDRNA2_185506_c0_seq1:20-433(-)